MTDRVIRSRFEAVTGQYQAAMAEMMASTHGVAKQIDSVGASSKGSFKSIGMDLLNVGSTGLIAGAGIAVGAAAILKFGRDGVTSYLNLADQVRAYKNVSGESAEESSKMIAVAHALGMETTTLSMGMFRLARNAQDHAAMLRADGVEVARNQQGQVDLAGTVENVAGAFQRAGAGAAGDKIVFDAFGRSGLTMIPILKENSDQLNALWDAAARHNQILTQDDLDKAFEYRVATRELGSAWTGASREIGAVAVPVLTGVANFLTREATGVGIITHAIAGLVPWHHSSASAAQQQAEAEQKLADTLNEAKQAADDFTASLDRQMQQTLAISSAQDQFGRDLFAIVDQVHAAQAAHDQYAISLDSTTSSGLANRQMLQGLVKDISDTAKAAATAAASQGASAQDQEVAVAAATERQRTELETVLERLGFNRDAVAEYTAALLGIPRDIESKIGLDTGAADAALKSYVDRLSSIPRFLASPQLAAARSVLAGVGIPDSIASPGLQQARHQISDLFTFLDDQAAKHAADNALAGSPASKAAENAASGYLDAIFQARMQGVENRFHAGQATLAEYERSLDEQMAHEVPWTNAWVALQQKKADAVHYWTDAAKTYLDALAAHQKELQDNEYTMGVLGKDQYLAILEERLNGLEKYSNAWTQIMQQIQQVEGAALDAQLKIIQAVDQQRLYDQAFYALAGQRQMSSAWQQGLTASLSPAQGGGSSSVVNSTSYTPSFVVTTADPVRAATTANQQMRDYAALVGV